MSVTREELDVLLKEKVLSAEDILREIDVSQCDAAFDMFLSESETVSELEDKWNILSNVVYCVFSSLSENVQKRYEAKDEYVWNDLQDIDIEEMLPSLYKWYVATKERLENQ